MDSDIGATATLVQQQHQTLDGNHHQSQKEQDNVNGTVESAEGHAVDRFRGEAECSVKEIAVVAPDNDSIGDSSTQCSDVINDDNEEEETDVEESGAGGWIMNPPVSTIVQQHQAFDTTNGYIALPNPDSSNFSDVRVKDSSNVHLGNEVNYNGPVTINQFVYTNPTPNQDAIELDVIRPSDNISDLSTNKDNGAPNGCIFPQYTKLNKVTQWFWTWKRAVISCVLTLILLAILVPITVHFTHHPDVSPALPEPTTPVPLEIPDSSTESFDPIVCCPTTNRVGTRPAQQSQSPTRTNNTVRPLKLDGSRGAVARAICAKNAKAVFGFARPRSVVIPPTRHNNVSLCALPARKLIFFGDKKAEAKEFPHMAAVGFNHPEVGILWLCGGSLISSKIVLTTADCTWAVYWGNARWVRLGDLNLAQRNDNAMPQTIGIQERIRHPDYKRPSGYHDIAILRLENEAIYTAFVRPACLPVDWPDVGQNDKAVATGWNLVLSDEDNLMKVTLNLVPHHSCNASFFDDDSFIELAQGIVNEWQICAEEVGEDTCQGDRGGPLAVFNTDYQCMYTIIGVSLERRCGSIIPGVYTRVYYYIPWIEKAAWPEYF